jgi:transposase
MVYQFSCMWTQENRALYDRSGLRYESDLTDAEWVLVAPLIPPAKHGGAKRSVEVREILNGLMYILSTGCQWRAIPKDLPPRSTLWGYFDRWEWDGTLKRIRHALYVQCREQTGREASPTAAIIDSQSVKSAEKGELDRSAWVRFGQEDQRQEAPSSRPSKDLGDHAALAEAKSACANRAANSTADSFSTPSITGGQRNELCCSCFQTSTKPLLSQTRIFTRSLRLAR